MAKIQEMTQLSPTMEEGTVVKWLKNEGDSVAPGEILAEVETDKAVMEMEAYDTGIILKIIQKEGSKCKVGEALAIIGKPGEDITDLLANLPKKSDKVETTKTEVAKNTQPEPKQEVATQTTSTIRNDASAGGGFTKQENLEPRQLPKNPEGRGKLRILASPLAKSIAIENGVDLHSVLGTGPEGRITKKDVLDVLSSGTPIKQQTNTMRTDQIIDLGGMRKTIAKRLTEAKQNLPHFYLNVDVDATALEQFRSDLLEFQKLNAEAEGIRLSLNDIIVKIVASSLRLHPKVNASFMGDTIKEYGRIDIGIAVSLDGGLLTPVVRNADQKSVLEISREIKTLAKKARERKLKPEEFTNGTFTISNLGMFGISRFTAIINEPESAILAVGSVLDKPVVKNGQVVAGRVLSLTLSCDHRVIDGAVGAEFLRTLKSLLENPSLALGV
ncbi:dihydrolipoamide acetyltransferase family protein [Leptospira sp. 96542]|nr:dihydrolipoamide acetyltransferase family protein [Leptospira sp. 96542]